MMNIDDIVNALHNAKSALEQVEEIEHTNWTRYTPGNYENTAQFVSACAWCHKEHAHTNKCIREIALAEINDVLEDKLWQK